MLFLPGCDGIGGVLPSFFSILHPYSTLYIAIDIYLADTLLVQCH